LRAPSPALVISLTALFISLSGTAVAAGVVPMAKQALFAKNAGKLQGKSARQVAAMPGPTNSVSLLTGEVDQLFRLYPGEEKSFTVRCPEGSRAISGGAQPHEPPNDRVATISSFPSHLENEWTVDVINLSKSDGAAVTVQAICLV